METGIYIDNALPTGLPPLLQRNNHDLIAAENQLLAGGSDNAWRVRCGVPIDNLDGGSCRAGNADLAAAVLIIHDQSLALYAPGNESFADYA